jgi:hypothetical protein
MGGACSTNWEEEEEEKNAYKLLVGIPEGNRPLGRPRRSWVDNINMHIGEIGM